MTDLADFSGSRGMHIQSVLSGTLAADVLNLVGLLALREYGREVGTHFGPTDFVALAQSFGASGFRVNNADELRPTLERALALASPAVIEISVDYRENLRLVQPLHLRAVD